MKFKHVVLFGVVASIMSYLNSETSSEQDNDRQEEILGEIKELLDSDANELTIAKKLDEIKEEIPEHYERAEEMAKDVSDDLIDELNSIVASLSSSEDDEPVSVQNNQPVLEPKKVEETVKEEDDYRKNLIKDLEDLLSGIEGEPKEPVVVAAPSMPEEKVIPEIEDLVDEIRDHEPEEVTQEDDDLSDYTEDDFLKQIEEAIANATNDLAEEDEIKEPTPVKEEVSESEIDDIFADILNQENKEPVVEETPTIKDEDAYLDELIDELKGDVKPETVEEVEPEVTEEDIYTKIHELYPCLNPSFIRSVYSLKESIAEEYPLNHRIIILHRLSFKDVMSLQTFTDIILKHDYRVNVDENKLIIDILKEFNNTDGKILTNIFEVANQAKVLNGEYEGYHIEVE